MTTTPGPPPAFRLSLLGSFRLEKSAPPDLEHQQVPAALLTLPTRKVESLLAYLVLHLEPQSREKLAALLWGDSSDQDARTSLRRALTLLRLHLSGESIIADRQTVQLNPNLQLWVDARAFEQAARQHLRHLPIETVADDKLQRTLAHYRGDLLIEFYDDWIVPEREYLRNLYLELLLASVQQSRAASHYARAIELAQQLLAADLANEQAYQHLMFCLAACGNRQAALQQYEQCRRALHDQLAVEPSAETIALYDWIRSGSGDSHVTAARITNLPIPLSSFIGRHYALGELTRLLKARRATDAPSASPPPHTTRLVTLLGVGGSGKTRLAIQVATALVGSFQDGVWWIDFAGLRDGAQVPQAVANALGVHGVTELSLTENLSNFLYSKKLLLVLDNCEHLLDACARVADELLGHCPDLKILTTSREALGIAGEFTWAVQPLSLPNTERVPSPRELYEFEAIQLFVERALAVKPDFVLTGENAAAVALVCQRLDGIPLALELAAARVKLLSVEQIAARLDDRFRLLTGGSRTALPRQQTLKATIDWSYDLLPADARALMRRLAVFAGGFSLHAAERICTDSGAGSPGILDLLALLVDRSLVSANYHGHTDRYGMLETLQEYARERLDEMGETAVYRVRHLDFFLELAEQVESELGGPQRLALLNQLETEHDNLNVALSSASTAPDSTAKFLRLTAALYQFWVWRGHHPEGLAWAQKALDSSRAQGIPSRQLHAKALGVAGIIQRLENWDDGTSLLSDCAALAREVGDEFTLAHALLFLGNYAHSAYDTVSASALHQESLALFRKIGNEWWLAYALGHMGNVLVEQSEFARARAYYQESISLMQRVGDVWTVQTAYYGLGTLSHAEQDEDKAMEFLTKALAITREIGDRYGSGVGLRQMGFVALSQGRDEYAQTLLEQALAELAAMGFKRFPWTVLALGRLALRQGDFVRALPLYQESLSLMLETFPPGKEDFGFLAFCMAGLSAMAEHLGQRPHAAQLLGVADTLNRSAYKHIRRLDPAMQAEYDHLVAGLHAALDVQEFAEQQAKGRAMTLDQAVALALA